jgi:hypothetical protein
MENKLRALETYKKGKKISLGSIYSVLVVRGQMGFGSLFQLFALILDLYRLAVDRQVLVRLDFHNVIRL